MSDTISHEYLAAKMERLEALSLARDEDLETKFGKIESKIDQMSELLETIAAFRSGGRFVVQFAKVLLAIGVMVALLKSGMTAIIDFKP